MITPNELFDLLSDQTRLRCLLLLQNNGELCVCELCSVLKSNQPKISRHLALMRNSSLLLDERRGQWVYYKLNSQLPKWALKIIKTTLTQLGETEPHRSDFVKLQNLRKTHPLICKPKSCG